MVFKVIASGSTGNAVLYHNSILVDCGVSFTKIKPYLYDIQLVLLTHFHSDHFNIQTLKKICDERPTIRIGCGEWMVDMVKHIKKLDIFEIGNIYFYGSFGTISPIKLYHDVLNCGYRIFKGEHKIIHATDTFTMEGIEAKDYNLYAIEHNYDENIIKDAIRTKTEKGEYVYENRSFNTHLSEQKAREWIRQNKGPNSEVIRLHQSEKY